MLFIGDDWAEGHHDVVVQDDAGRTLARRRLPEGVDGIARFHDLVASCLGEDGEPDPAQVVIVIETDRGAWVRALAAAGYEVCAVNPKQAARHKETISVSGKKDDFFDAACLADMGRTRRHQIRELAADSDLAEAVKIAARAHQKLVWERTRHLLRMRSALREYFPAALEAYAPLTLSGPDALELLRKAPDPESAAKLTAAQITAALKRAGRRGGLPQRAQDIQAALRTPHLAQAAVITEAHAASVMAATAVITILNEQIKAMETKVSGLFHRHPDAGIYLSQPGIGDITGARVLGEFGDAAGRYATAKARKNYAGTSPLTIQSGKSKTAHARFIRNRHLIDALHAQALSALTASPGARAFYDELRAREVGHDDAMRRVASRFTGILHGCLKHGRDYDEATAWAHRAGLTRAA
ncbi:MAG TPA: IS110 family transposase [Streptosporangiaceae bacterium]|nr:IS110 family transposase [Streptosporangiaceae bacterium]